MHKRIILLLMAFCLFSCGSRAQKPQGELTFCRYVCSGAAGLGTDYCTLVAEPDSVPKVVVVLNDDNRFDDPVIQRSYPVEKSVVDSLQQLLESAEIYKLDGYYLEEAITGGHSYSFRFKYSSGDEVSASWYGHGVKEEVLVAYNSIEKFFSPWCEQTAKDAALQERIERITAMEQRYDRLLKAVKKRKAYPALKEDANTLQDYMDQKLWQEDFEADERGELPKEMKRGVLSEDGLYNLLNSEKLYRLKRGL